MQSDFLDRKLYKMAEQEQMAVSEDLDARVDDILRKTAEAADTITASGGRRFWRQLVWYWRRRR